MRRFALSPRRLLAAAALGVVGAVAFASTASACTIGVTGTPECDTQAGTYTITWVVTASDNANVKSHTATPTDVTLPSTIKAGKTGITVTQTVPGTAKEATLEVELTNADRKPTFDLKKKGTVELKGDCVATKPSESPSASPSAPASASPSQTAVAPVSSSPASGTGAGSTLPVTGTSLTWFIVAAVVLIGGGAALFFVSRRRRTNA